MLYNRLHTSMLFQGIKRNEYIICGQNTYLNTKNICFSVLNTEISVLCNRHVIHRAFFYQNIHAHISQDGINYFTSTDTTPSSGSSTTHLFPTTSTPTDITTTVSKTTGILLIGIIEATAEKRYQIFLDITVCNPEDSQCLYSPNN